MKARTAPVGAIAVLADQTLQTHPACSPEEIRTDLAALERINEDAFGAASGREGRELIERRPPTRASASVVR
jgi:hypothetical protein